jgi:hypothetical protein
MKIIDEIPFTSEALKIYIEEAEKRISQIFPYVSEYNKLKTRIKKAHEKLMQRPPTGVI